jgi:hypothetical protein
MMPTIEDVVVMLQSAVMIGNELCALIEKEGGTTAHPIMYTTIEAYRAQLRALDLTAPMVYPRGQLNEEDEGELAVRIERALGPEGPVVIMRFGKRIAWLALPADQVRALAAMLVRHADAEEGNPNGDPS